MTLFSPHTTRVSHEHSELITALIDYHDSGAYERDLAGVGEEALAYVRALPPADTKQAMVLDIDETSLFNQWSALVDPEYGYDPQAWDAWIADACAPAIESTLAVFEAARKRGIDVFFITGRHPDQEDVTVKNLEKAGYGDFAEVYVEPRAKGRSDNLVFPEASAFKTATRWSITERGWEIVLNMGDQLSDVQGGFARKTFKLPNPFYVVI